MNAPFAARIDQSIDGDEGGDRGHRHMEPRLWPSNRSRRRSRPRCWARSAGRRGHRRRARVGPGDGVGHRPDTGDEAAGRNGRHITDLVHEGSATRPGSGRRLRRCAADRAAADYRGGRGNRWCVGGPRRRERGRSPPGNNTYRSGRCEFDEAYAETCGQCNTARVGVKARMIFSTLQAFSENARCQIRTYAKKPAY